MVADALSRIPSINNLSTISLDLGDLISLYKKDPYFAYILETLQNIKEASEKQIARAKHFKLQENKIYLKEGERLAIPKDKELRTKLLIEHYDINISGYLGIDKTYESLRRNFYWPKMGKDVYKFVTTCDSCQRNKSSNQTPAGLLQPLSTPSRRWEQITMNFIIQLPVTRKGYDAIVVFVDRLTKRAIFCSTNISITAPEVAKIFFNNIFQNHKLPKVIISDRDTKFTSNFWKTLFKQLGTKLSMSTAFHLQTDS